jgi:hypothetical protein
MADADTPSNSQYGPVGPIFGARYFQHSDWWIVYELYAMQQEHAAIVHASRSKSWVACEDAIALQPSWKSTSLTVAVAPNNWILLEFDAGWVAWDALNIQAAMVSSE